MIPLHDDNPITRTPVLTVALVVACVGAFIWLMGLDDGSREWAAFTLGAVPAVLAGEASLEPYFAGFPPEASVLTLMFLHAGWLHLGGNMLYLWIFGNNVEDRLGHGRFLALYLIAGLVGTAAHIAADPASEVPLIGASGAVSGVLGAYLLLYPHARIKMIFPPFLFRTFRVPAWLFLGFWFVFQGLNAAGGFDLASEGPVAAEGGIAWMAHVGGFVAGMVLLLVLRPAGVPLFARPGQRARAPGAPAPWGKSAGDPASPPSPAGRIVGGGPTGTIRRTDPPPGRIVSR
jgi:membrane associated rhomboid family serine protease